MVLVHYTLSECALQMFEVSLKYLLGFSSYRADAILFLSDGQTDKKTKGKKQYVSRPIQGEYIINQLEHKTIKM